jgi:MSHA biogenesis protein MshM
VGTGKTLLCRQLLNSLGDGFVTAYLHNPFMTPDSLLLGVAEELGLALPAGTRQHQVIKALSLAVMRSHADGRRVVVCLDEAQALPLETLETLRLLTNLETEKRKLIQVVLFGQPELDAMLARPSVRQLRQRITYSYELLPMNRVEVGAYLTHRLAVAGYAGPPLFSPAAVDLVHLASRGIPRLVNIIGNKSLMLAWARGRTSVSRRETELAVRDTLDAQSDAGRRLILGRMRLPAWLYSALGLVAMFAFGAVWSVVQ